MKFLHPILQVIHLPAFTAEGQGLCFQLELNCKSLFSKHDNHVTATGGFASSFLPLFERIRGILLSLQASWRILDQCSINIHAEYPKFRVADFQSAGLGIAVAFYNVARAINGSMIAANITGTGAIRLDGSVTEVRGIISKKHAVKQLPANTQLIVPDDIQHLTELHCTLWKTIHDAGSTYK
ncbi:MAG: hypothetical protein KAH18_02605 [Psychromonas sp.]|nr:hypothetical protein [Psychromonas sp.]